MDVNDVERPENALHDRLSNLAPKCFNKMRPLEFAKDQMNYDFHKLEFGTNFYSYDGLEFGTNFYRYDGLWNYEPNVLK